MLIIHVQDKNIIIIIIIHNLYYDINIISIIYIYIYIDIHYANIIYIINYTSQKHKLRSFELNAFQIFPMPITCDRSRQTRNRPKHFKHACTHKHFCERNSCNSAIPISKRGHTKRSISWVSKYVMIPL